MNGLDYTFYNLILNDSFYHISRAWMMDRYLLKMACKYFLGFLRETNKHSCWCLLSDWFFSNMGSVGGRSVPIEVSFEKSETCFSPTITIFIFISIFVSDDCTEISLYPLLTYRSVWYIRNMWITIRHVGYKNEGEQNFQCGINTNIGGERKIEIFN